MAWVKENDSQFSNGGNFATRTSAIGFTPTQGRLLVVLMTGPASSNPVTQLATTNVTWSGPYLIDDSSRRGRMFFGVVGAAPGTDITMTQDLGVYPNGPGFWEVSVAEYSGGPAGGGYQAAKSQKAAAGSGTVVSTGNVTPAAGSQSTLLVAMLRGNGTAPSVPAGWTQLGTSPNSAQMMLYRVVANADGATAYGASGTFGSSNPWYAAIATFQAGTLTAEIDAPLTELSGQPMAFALRAKLDGVLDPTFTGTATLSKVSGSGTLSGTLTTAAFVNGAATLATPALSSSGAHVLRATLTNGVTVDTPTITIRALPYSNLNGYRNLEPIVVGGYQFGLQVREHSTASAGTPQGVLFWLPQSAKAQANYGTAGTLAAAQACINAIRTDAFGTRVDAGTHAGFLVVFCPEIDQSNNAARHQWRAVFRAIITRLKADGYNIDERLIFGCGWSTGAIQSQFIAFGQYGDPTLWAGFYNAETSIVSSAFTDYGVGAPEGYLPGSYFDPPKEPVGSHTLPSEYDGTPSADVAGLTEIARLFDVHGIALANVMADGTDSATNTTKAAYTQFYGRQINDLNVNAAAPGYSLLEQLAARGKSTANTAAAKATAWTLNTSDRYVQRKLTDGTHDDANNFAYSAANFPSGLAWMLANPKPLSSGGVLLEATARRRRRVGR